MGSYEELEFNKKENLNLRIICFIKMLNEGNQNILKSTNKENFEGFPNVKIARFWGTNKNREIIVRTLFDKLKENHSYDTARGLILKNLKTYNNVNSVEEYYEKIEKESNKLKDNKKIKKELEETIKMIDDIYELLNHEEQRKSA